MSDAQAPDPIPPRPVPRPPRPTYPERDVPERDDPDEPEPEKPPTLPWRNEAKVWSAAVTLGTLLALTQPAVAQLRELMSAARAECQAKALSKAHDKDLAASSQPGTAAAHAIADEIESGEVTRRR